MVFQGMGKCFETEETSEGRSSDCYCSLGSV